MSTLYQLTREYEMLLDLADDPEVDMQAIADTMDSIGGELEDKADGYARVMKQIQSENEGIRAEIKRLYDRLNRNENVIDTMKMRLKDSMIATGKTKFKTDLFSFSVRNNGGKTPIIYNVFDYAELPEEFRKETVSYKADDKAVRDYLDAGNVSEFFKYGERGTNLSIK